MPQKKKKAKKNWELAYRVIQAHIIKNNGNTPSDSFKWKRLIKSNLHKDLYPFFQTDKDFEELATKACEIDPEVVLRYRDYPVCILQTY